MLRLISRAQRSRKTVITPYRCPVRQPVFFHTSKRLTNKQPEGDDALNVIGDLIDKKLIDIGRQPTNVPLEASLENLAYIKPRLTDIVKIDLLEAASTEKIKEIWKDYHMKKYCLSATVDSTMYQKLRDISEKYPMFLVPIPKEQGAMFFVLAYTDNTFRFTSLAQYQLYQSQDDPANAPPALTIKFYTELMDSKQVVLMRGQIDPVQMDVQEAQLLVNQFQLYYLGDEDKLHLVKVFNENPSQFDYNDLLSFVLPNKIE